MESARHIALRNGQLPALQIERPIPETNPRWLPCGLANHPHEHGFLGLIAQGDMAENGAIDAGISADRFHPRTAWYSPCHRPWPMLCSPARLFAMMNSTLPRALSKLCRQS